MDNIAGSCQEYGVKCRTGVSVWYPYGACIWKNYVNDGTEHCEDGSDESGKDIAWFLKQWGYLVVDICICFMFQM